MKISTIPPDDLTRELAVADRDDPVMQNIFLAGGTYTVLLSGAQTGGRYCLIDMLVPPGGGPPPHRHDFEEMFTILEGEVDLNFRGKTQHAGAGTTVNIPANAPHSFKNNSAKVSRMLCMCTPAGQEEYFAVVGDTLPSRTSPPPKLTEAERAERGAKAKALAAKYKTEFI